MFGNIIYYGFLEKEAKKINAKYSKCNMLTKDTLLRKVLT